MVALEVFGSTNGTSTVLPISRSSKKFDSLELSLESGKSSSWLKYWSKKLSKEFSKEGIKASRSLLSNGGNSLESVADIV